MEDVMARMNTAAAPGPLRVPFAGLRRWWRERRMADELYALDDMLLKDIGVYRGEIPSIIRAYRARPGRP
jgi:uncharacterized protein YjiS (DUF1127 family)